MTQATGRTNSVFSGRPNRYSTYQPQLDEEMPSKLVEVDEAEEEEEEDGDDDDEAF